MKTVCKQMDENLAHLAWSLWTELGVVGLERKHQLFSVAPEELIILTSLLSTFDPRLRDEALDWCSRYHRFISPLRLQTLAEKYKIYVAEAFSVFSTTLNGITTMRTKWPVLEKKAPLKVRLSGKSILRNFEAPAMVHFRLRSLLGVGARADVVFFLLNEKRRDFAIADLLETGYSKRRLAALLEDLSLAGILSEAQVRNQFRYVFVKQDLFIKLLGGLPQKMTNWDQVLAVLLPIRACLQAVEDAPVGVRVIDMRNLLNKLVVQLSQIKLIPPPLQNDLEAYWKSVTKWVIDFSAALSKGKI